MAPVNDDNSEHILKQAYTINKKHNSELHSMQPTFTKQSNVIFVIITRETFNLYVFAWKLQ